MAEVQSHLDTRDLSQVRLTRSPTIPKKKKMRQHFPRLGVSEDATIGEAIASISVANNPERSFLALQHLLVSEGQTLLDCNDNFVPPNFDQWNEELFVVRRMAKD